MRARIPSPARVSARSFRVHSLCPFTCTNCIFLYPCFARACLSFFCAMATRALFFLYFLGQLATVSAYVESECMSVYDPVGLWCAIAMASMSALSSPVLFVCRSAPSQCGCFESVTTGPLISRIVRSFGRASAVVYSHRPWPARRTGGFVPGMVSAPPSVNISVLFFRGASGAAGGGGSLIFSALF